MKVQVIDVSRKGPDWKEVLPTVLHAPIFSFQVAPFKGVTNLLILGENGTVAVAVSDLETETESASVSSGAVFLEVGVEKPKLIYCRNCRERLPNKLGELLSSMYLVPTISSAKHSCAKKSIEIYG